MNNNIVELKKITNLIIDEFNADKDINELLEKRNNIISEIINDKESKEENKEMYIELEIEKDEKKLVSLLENKKDEIRNEIKICQKRKKAYRNYSNANNPDNSLFSRRV